MGRKAANRIRKRAHEFSLPCGFMLLIYSQNNIEHQVNLNIPDQHWEDTLCVS